jgi:hypothetical protein
LSSRLSSSKRRVAARYFTLFCFETAAHGKTTGRGNNNYIKLGGEKRSVIRQRPANSIFSSSTCRHGAHAERGDIYPLIARIAACGSRLARKILLFSRRGSAHLPTPALPLSSARRNPQCSCFVQQSKHLVITLRSLGSKLRISLRPRANDAFILIVFCTDLLKGRSYSSCMEMFNSAA